MPKSDNQKLKLLYIEKLLREKTDDNHSVTVKDIIEYLGENDIAAERKSIYSDIENLERFGYEINMDDSKRRRGYSLAEREFEISELKMLSDAVSAFKFISPKDLNKLLTKISHLASDYDALKLKREVRLTNRADTIEKDVIRSVDYIHEAMNNNYQLSFKYSDWNEKKKKVYRHGAKFYRVSPWALIFDDEKYYLMAYDHQDEKIKNYRVDRMDNVKYVDEKRLGEEKFAEIDMDNYTSAVFSMYAGEKETVTLSFRNGLANVVIDRFGKEPAFVKVDDEHFSVAVNVSVSDQFYGWLAGLGDGVKILAPQTAADGYKAHLEKILGSYK